MDQTSIPQFLTINTNFNLRHGHAQLLTLAGVVFPLLAGARRRRVGLHGETLCLLLVVVVFVVVARWRGASLFG